MKRRTAFRLAGLFLLCVVCMVLGYCLETLRIWFAAAVFAPGGDAGTEEQQVTLLTEPLPAQGAEAGIAGVGIYAYQLESEVLQGDGNGEVSYYYYSHLPEEDQELYTALYQGLMDMEESITLGTADHEHIFAVEMLVLCDHPEIFWYAGEGTVMRYALRTELVPKYTISMEERLQREAKIAETVEAFRARISPGETNYEKLATAFSFITRNVDYEMGMPDDQNICSSLINGKSVCAGYARGMQYLLQQVGIQRLYVYGSVNGEGDHAWNIVNLDGTYYHSDVTFGDRSFENDDEVNLPDVLKAEYGYMCMNDETALRDRTLTTPDLAVLPSCDSTECAYYRRHGWFYTEYTDQVWSDVRKELNTGERCWHFQFGSKDAYERFKEEVYDNRFSKIALDELGWYRIETYLLANDTLYVMTGWIP